MVRILSLALGLCLLGLAAEASAQTAATGGGLCRPGAKLEGLWGISWYEVTVLAAPNAEGKCKVRFDGYGSEWDTLLVPDGLRARGGGPITRPSRPVADTPPAKAPTTSTAAGALPATAPDGTYRCHKISPGGQLMDIGTLTIRGGKGVLAGMPQGWTVRSIAPRARNDRGQLVVAFDYRSAAGFNDRLDCVR